MQVFGLITARGGSKEFPGKNIRAFRGKPLVNWTVEAALQAKRTDRVLFSTEDEDIGKAVESVGCEVPFNRSKELVEDFEFMPVLYGADNLGDVQLEDDFW